MARKHFRAHHQDAAGNAIQNARVRVHYSDGISPVTDLFAVPEGGIPVDAIYTDPTGEYEFWLDEPKTVVTVIDDNDGTAILPAKGNRIHRFIPVTETAEVHHSPEDLRDPFLIVSGDTVFAHRRRLRFADDKFLVIDSEDSDEYIIDLHFDAPPPDPPGDETFPKPEITSFSPVQGPIGSDVVITGTDFSGTGSLLTPFTIQSVKFAGVLAQVFTVDSATQITARVPEGAIDGPIVVTTTANRSAISPTDFDVTAPPAENTPPVAGFTATPESGVAPLGVTFTNTSSDPDPGDTLVYFWELGDGNTSTDVHPAHTYQNPGSYVVKLTVMDNHGAVAGTQKTISVQSVVAELKASISAVPTKGQVPLTVQLDGSAVGGQAPYSWLWTHGDGSTSELQNHQHIFQNPGMFTVTLQVTDNLGESNTVSVMIEVTGVTDVITLAAGETVRKTDWVLPPGTMLRFPANQSATLIMDNCNLILDGAILQAHPANIDITHRIKFRNVSEAAFGAGGGVFPNVDSIPRSDKGLWVVNNGQLDLVGTFRQPWNRTGDHTSWRNTDALRLLPSGSGAANRGFDAPYPLVSRGTLPPLHSGTGLRSEVINTTRNVIIESEQGHGKAHVLVHAHAPQTVKYVDIPRMGPQKNGEGVLGRYPLHFHHGGDGSRGSVIEGVVVRDSGNHGFVPHESHGVTLKNNIAYNISGAPYFWDFGDVSNDIVYDGNVGAKVTDTPRLSQHSTIFHFLLGIGNIARNNVAVGMASPGAAGQTAGFGWIGKGDVWEFDVGNVSHNNGDIGLSIWQNTRENHRIRGWKSYHDRIGGRLGAYGNPYHFDDCDIYECGDSGFVLKANSRPDRVEGKEQRFTGVRLRMGGNTDYVLEEEVAHLPPNSPSSRILMHNLVLGGWKKAAIKWNDRGGVGMPNPGHPKMRDFVQCLTRKSGETADRELQPTDFEIEALADPRGPCEDGSAIPIRRIRVQRANGTAFAWDYDPSQPNNAKFIPSIPAFYP